MSYLVWSFQDTTLSQHVCAWQVSSTNRVESKQSYHWKNLGLHLQQQGLRTSPFHRPSTCPYHPCTAWWPMATAHTTNTYTTWKARFFPWLSNDIAGKHIGQSSKIPGFFSTFAQAHLQAWFPIFHENDQEGCAQRVQRTSVECSPLWSIWKHNTKITTSFCAISKTCTNQHSRMFLS